MALKAEVSIPVALATGTLVYGIYQVALPSIADVRSLEPGTPDIAGAEKTALWMSAAAAAAVSLIARDPVPFWVGGMLAVALSWSHRHANWLNPATQTLDVPMVGFLGRRVQVQAEG